MGLHLHKKSILKKTFQVGWLTGVSRCCAIIREILTVRFLGISALSDAFIVAFRIPNFLRKIFAEGALSAAFVPLFVSSAKSGSRRDASRLVALAFLFFEGIILLLCVIVFWRAEQVVRMIAPGFTAQQVVSAVPLLRILFPFIFFISSSALLAGAFQAVNHFFIPAAGPVLLNVAWIVSAWACLRYNLSVEVLCFGIIAGGVLQLLAHFVWYFKSGFWIYAIDAETVRTFMSALKKFAHCLIGVGAVEINLFLDTIIGSYLPHGSVSVLYYGARFIGIPLGIFSIAFSTILLSHFSRVALYAPRRLHYYLLEATKFICWVVLPTTFFLILVSEKVFSTIVFAKNVAPYQIWQATWVLIIMAIGLVFFSLNKVISNVFYALHDTWTPTAIALFSTLVNAAGNIASILFLSRYAIFGIAASTVLSGVVVTVMSFYALKSKYRYRLYGFNLLGFFGRYIPQVIIGFVVFILVHKTVFASFTNSYWQHFFLAEFGYWFITLPLAGLLGLFFLFTKDLFNVKLYFLER